MTRRAVLGCLLAACAAPVAALIPKRQKLVGGTKPTAVCAEPEISEGNVLYIDQSQALAYPICFYGGSMYTCDGDVIYRV